MQIHPSFSPMSWSRGFQWRMNEEVPYNTGAPAWSMLPFVLPWHSGALGFSEHRLALQGDPPPGRQAVQTSHGGRTAYLEGWNWWVDALLGFGCSIHSENCGWDGSCREGCCHLKFPSDLFLLLLEGRRAFESLPSPGWLPPQPRVCHPQLPFAFAGADKQELIDDSPAQPVRNASLVLLLLHVLQPATTWCGF